MKAMHNLNTSLRQPSNSKHCWQGGIYARRFCLVSALADAGKRCIAWKHWGFAKQFLGIYRHLQFDVAPILLAVHQGPAALISVMFVRKDPMRHILALKLGWNIRVQDETFWCMKWK